MSEIVDFEVADAAVKKYEIKIIYFTRNNVGYEVYARNESDAREFAFARFKDDYTAKCLNPEVEYIKKK